MDCVVKRSFDYGHTWTKSSLVYPNAEHQAMGTPTTILDPTTNTIFLFLSPQNGGRDAHDGRRVMLLNSTDGGQSWSEPRNMTAVLVPDDWDNVWMGTQQGIVVPLPDEDNTKMDLGRSSTSSGQRQRLIMCANHHGRDSNGAHTVYSDDHGLTWQNGVTLSHPASLGECGLTHTVDNQGQSVVTMYSRVVYDDASISKPRRSLAFSRDYGHSFVSFANATHNFPGNPGADAQGSFVEFNGTFLVASPWGQVSPANPGRHNFTVLMSQSADGKPTTWTAVPGADPLTPAAIEAEYSTMMVVDQAPPTNRTGTVIETRTSTVFVLYERGNLYGMEPGQPNSSLRLTQLPFPTPTV